MARGKKTGGRQKGTPNKSTSRVKDAILAAYEGIGGDVALTAWARKNKTLFYTKVLPRILPTEVSGPDGGPVPLSGDFTVRFVKPSPSDG